MVGLAQLVSASGCGPEGRGFESHISPQQKTHLHLQVRFLHDACHHCERREQQHFEHGEKYNVAFCDIFGDAPKVIFALKNNENCLFSYNYCKYYYIIKKLFKIMCYNNK